MRGRVGWSDTWTRCAPNWRSAGETETFETIYMGGGTPTVLPVDALLSLVQDFARRLKPGGGPTPGAAPGSPEFTIEANPGTIDAPVLERLAEAGVTRLSLGVQSFSPALRAALGRRGHSEGDLRRSRGHRRYWLAGVEPRPGVRHPRADVERRRRRSRRGSGRRAHPHLLLRSDLHAGIRGISRGRGSGRRFVGRHRPRSRGRLRRTALRGSHGQAGGRRLPNATRSPTSLCLGTNAGTTKPTGGAKTTWASAPQRCQPWAASDAPIRARSASIWPGHRRRWRRFRRRRGSGRRPCWDCARARGSRKRPSSRCSIWRLGTGFWNRAVWRGAVVNCW